MSLIRDTELLRPPLKTQQDDDLGIGRIQAERARSRFLNKDGSFNSKRLGLTWFESLSPFYWMLSISWSAFFGIITAAFLIVNIFFAVLYTLCGPDALQMTTFQRRNAIHDWLWAYRAGQYRGAHHFEHSGLPWVARRGIGHGSGLRAVLETRL
jgi:hypothetical protein